LGYEYDTSQYGKPAFSWRFFIPKVVHFHQNMSSHEATDTPLCAIRGPPGAVHRSEIRNSEQMKSVCAPQAEWEASGNVGG